MATWFTADLHLGHSNIIDYCGRPFANVDAMSRALIDNWNQAIAEDDTIWVIGDFALGKTAETLPLVAELTGHKILIASSSASGTKSSVTRSGLRPATAAMASMESAEEANALPSRSAARIAIIICPVPERAFDSTAGPHFVTHSDTAARS